MLKIAIEHSEEVISACKPMLMSAGLDFDRHKGESYIRSSNFPAEAIVIGHSEILNFLLTKAVDIVFCNEITMADYSCRSELPFSRKMTAGEKEFKMISRLGLGKTNLSLFVPAGTKFKSIEWLSGKVVVTEYDSLLGNYLRSNGIKATVLPMHNYLDSAIEAGLADAVCVALPDGEISFDNRYKNVGTIESGELEVVARPDLSPATQMILDDFMTRILSTKNAKGKKSVSMTIPITAIPQLTKEIISENKPFILRDEPQNKAFVNMVIDDTRLWDMMEKLKALEADNIIVCNIESIIYRG